MKFRVYSFEARCAVIISRGFVEGENKLSILKLLKNELARFTSTAKLNRIESHRLWLFCNDLYRKIARQVRGNRTDNESVYRAIKKQLSMMERVKNAISLSVEVRDKHGYLEELKSSGIFYLCSKHSKCAKGHEDYQGRVYVSENWRERCTDVELVEKISAYIRNHDCLTIEEVVGAPIYMVRRPNCKHYFIALDTDEVLHNSVGKLLKKHDMIEKVSKGSYEYFMYRSYYERLKVLLGLRDVCPCDLLEADIKSARKKMKKWLSLIS